MSILAQPIRSQFADLDCFVEPIPCVLRSHPTNGVEVHGNYRLPAKNFQRTCKNLKFHLWRGPTFKKLQKTWRQGPTLQKHEKPWSSTSDRDQPPITITMIPIWNQCWWRVWSNEALDRIKGSWTKQDTFFCNLKTSNKTSQFETSSKPWNQFEMSISCVWQPSYHMRRTDVKYTSSLDKNLDSNRLYRQVPLALEIQVAFGIMERWTRLDHYTLRYT